MEPATKELDGSGKPYCYVIKRDGSKDNYSIIKIYNALAKAFESVYPQEKERYKEKINTISENIDIIIQKDYFSKNDTIGIETIQDIVEQELSSHDEFKVMKAYIIYRYQHEKNRDDANMRNYIDAIMGDYLSQADWKVKENSNVHFGIGGLILHNSSEITKKYWLDKIYPKEVKDAHLSCAIHLHDLGMFSGYCFVGETPIRIPHGEDLTFKELVDEGIEEIDVYAYDSETKSYVQTKGIYPRITRKVKELIEITFSNCERPERVTLDHKFMLRTGEYKQAKDFTVGEEVMPHDLDKIVTVTQIKHIELEKEIDMYDLTVPKYHNFVLASGIVSSNCAGWSIRDLLERGLGGVKDKISSKPPRHLSTAVQQIVNFLGIMQNEWAGAQAFSSFDTYLAPFIKKDHMTEEQVRQCIQTFLFAINTPSRWGCIPVTTEILTDNGWKDYKSFNKQKDKVYQIETTVEDYEYEDDKDGTTVTESLVLDYAKKVIYKDKEDLPNVGTHIFIGDDYYQQVSGDHRVAVSHYDEYAERNETTYQTATAVAKTSKDTRIYVPNTIPALTYDNNHNEVLSSRIQPELNFTDTRILSKYEIFVMVVYFMLLEKAKIYQPDKDKKCDGYIEFVFKSGERDYRDHIKSCCVNLCEKELSKKCLESDFSPLCGKDEHIIYLTSTDTLCHFFSCFTDPTKKFKSFSDLKQLVKYFNTEYATDFITMWKKLQNILFAKISITFSMESKTSSYLYCDNAKMSSILQHIGVIARKTSFIHQLPSKRSAFFVIFREEERIEIKSVRNNVPNTLTTDYWCVNVAHGNIICRDRTENPLSGIGKRTYKNVFLTGNCQAPFSNVTIDMVCPDDLKEKNVMLGGELQDFTYGDCQKEMDLFNRIFIEEFIKGDSNGRGFQYPIPTYNITKDFNWESDNARLLFTMTSKYGIPYFQNFVNSDLNPSDVRSMCCRLQLDKREIRRRTGGIFGSDEWTGSIGVVTINLPQLGYLSRKNTKTIDEAIEYFYKELDRLMEVGKVSLEIKRKTITRLKDNGFFPYTKAYLYNFRNHFSTFGIIGSNECCLNLFGKDITDPECKTFIENVIKHMVEHSRDFQEETGNLYNVEFVPGEGTTYRFAKHDVETYGDIITAGVKSAPYYTGSTWLPVNKTVDIFEMLDHQESLQRLATGGTVAHLFLGEQIKDPDTCKELVKTVVENYKLPYFTISPTYSICPVHGYLNGEQFTCPLCKEEAEHEIQDEINRLKTKKEALLTK